MSVAEALKNPITRLYVEELIECEDKDEARELQRALVGLGQRIMVDGDIGPITVAAIKRVNNKALARAILDAREHKKIVPTDRPPWIDAAYHELGIKECRGKGCSNPRVEQYHDAVGIAWAEDDVPWCGSFVGFCVLKAGLGLPEHPYRALSWLDWGRSAHKPVYGAVAVKRRKGGGHVTFVVGQSADGRYLYCLGGNQNDAVNIARYRKEVFVDFRIQTDYQPPKKLAVLSGAGGSVREA